MQSRGILLASVAVAAVGAVAALLLARSCNHAEPPAPDSTPGLRAPTQPPPRDRAAPPEEATPVPLAPDPPLPRPAPTPRRWPDPAVRGTLEVVVVRGEDSQPIAGAEVVLDAVTAPQLLRDKALQKKRTAADGRVSFEVEERPYVVDVTPGATGPGGGGLSGASRAVLGPGRCVVELRATRRLVVRVTVEGGRPEAPVLVGWRVSDPDLFGRAVPGRSGGSLVDAAGTCELHVEDGRYEILAGPEGRTSELASTHGGVVDAAAGEVSIDLVRGVWLEVAGVDFDPGIKMPANAAIEWRAQPSAGSAARSKVHRIEAPGPLRSPGVVQPGRYDVEADLIDRKADGVVGSGVLKGLTAGSGSARLWIGPSASVTGRVVDDRGAPLVLQEQSEPSRVYVSAYRTSGDRRLLTDADCDVDGKFVLKYLPSGPVDLEVNCDSDSQWSLPERRRVESGATGVELHLSPAVAIHGRIDCPAAIGRFRGTAVVAGTRVARVHPDGAFELTGLRPGSVRLRWIVERALLADLGEVVAPAQDVVLRADLR